MNEVINKVEIIKNETAQLDNERLLKMVGERIVRKEIDFE
jgi:hypothetical protein